MSKAVIDTLVLVLVIASCNQTQSDRQVEAYQRAIHVVNKTLGVNSREKE